MVGGAQCGERRGKNKKTNHYMYDAALPVLARNVFAWVSRLDGQGLPRFKTMKTDGSG